MTRYIARSILVSLVILSVFSIVFIGVVAAQQPKPGGTLKIAFESDVPGLDPHTSLGVQVQVLIPSLFNTLVTIDENLEVVHEDHQAPTGKSAFGIVLVQILALDIVFSLDSVITAVGMAQHISVMVAAM